MDNSIFRSNNLMNLATATIGATIVGDTVKKVPVKDDALVSNAETNIKYYLYEYHQQGLTTQMAQWNVIQDYMESGAYSNTGARNNNPGNIVWANQPNAVKGPAMTGNPGYYWARFTGPTAYVAAKIKLLYKSPGEPILATTATDFVHRLALNHYFGNESEASYAAKMKGVAQRMNIVSDLVTDSHQNILVPDNAFSKLWAKFRALPLPVQIGAGAAGGLIILKILK